jgi:hypothetical protein
MLVMWSTYRQSVYQCISDRDTINQWSKPDTPEGTTFYTLCHAKQDEMRRLITAANLWFGSTYGDALAAITQDPEASKDLNKEDLYVLVQQGMDEEWTTTAGYRAFVRPKAAAEQAGWSRTTRGIKG